MVISSIVSVLILWSGDYTARIQFDGPLKTEIKGELVDDGLNRSNSDCEAYGRFEEVLLVEKNQPEKFIKVDFRFVCSQPAGPPQEIKIASEMVRASDLKTHSTTIYISKKYKKNQFKIEQFALTTSQKSSKTSSK